MSALNVNNDMYVDNFYLDHICFFNWGRDDVYSYLDDTHLPYHGRNIIYLIFNEGNCIFKEFYSQEFMFWGLCQEDHHIKLLIFLLYYLVILLISIN
jgi:hypothetical protein